MSGHCHGKDHTLNKSAWMWEVGEGKALPAYPWAMYIRAGGHTSEGGGTHRHCPEGGVHTAGATLLLASAPCLAPCPTYALLPYCPTALLPYCPIALLLYCPRYVLSRLPLLCPIAPFLLPPASSSIISSYPMQPYQRPCICTPVHLAHT